MVKVSLLFIIGLMIALILMMVALPVWLSPLRPAWLLLFLMAWTLLMPSKSHVLLAFIIGILNDVFSHTFLGEHALIFVFIVYLLQRFQQVIRGFPFWQQMFLFAVLIVLNTLYLNIIQGMTNTLINAHQLWFEGISSIIFWPLVYSVMRWAKLRYQIG